MTNKPEPTVDLGFPTEARGKNPSFSSIEKEAEFWDTHDSTDFNDEFVPVELKVGENFRESVTIQLTPADRDSLDRIAREKDLEPSDLAKRWIVERLSDAKAKAS